MNNDFYLSCSGVVPAVELTRKLISALEAIEKLPVFTYDLPGSGYGLQVNFSCAQKAARVYLAYPVT